MTNIGEITWDGSRIVGFIEETDEYYKKLHKELHRDNSPHKHEGNKLYFYP